MPVGRDGRNARRDCLSDSGFVGGATYRDGRRCGGLGARRLGHEGEPAFRRVAVRELFEPLGRAGKA